MGSSAATPIASSNIGFQLVKKHGWKEETGLGISKQQSRSYFSTAFLSFLGLRKESNLALKSHKKRSNRTNRTAPIVPMYIMAFRRVEKSHLRFGFGFCNLLHHQNRTAPIGLSNCTLINEQLYLAGNKISDVEWFHRLLKPTILDLSFNKITTAKALGQIVGSYNSLLALNLLGNPIQNNISDDQLRQLAAVYLS